MALAQFCTKFDVWANQNSLPSPQPPETDRTSDYWNVPNPATNQFGNRSKTASGRTIAAIPDVAESGWDRDGRASFDRANSRWGHGALLPTSDNQPHLRQNRGFSGPNLTNARTQPRLFDRTPRKVAQPFDLLGHDRFGGRRSSSSTPALLPERNSSLFLMFAINSCVRN